METRRIRAASEGDRARQVQCALLHSARESIQARTRPVSSRTLAGSVSNGRDDVQPTSYPGPTRPCAPRILLVSKLTLSGGQPKKSSHGSYPGLLWISTWLA